MVNNKIEESRIEMGNNVLSLCISILTFLTLCYFFISYIKNLLVIVKDYINQSLLINKTNKVIENDNYKFERDNISYDNTRNEILKSIKNIRTNYTDEFSKLRKYKEDTNNYKKPTKSNPLMNVMLPEIGKNPTRKPAAPAYDEDIEMKINEKAANIGLEKKLFRDLNDSIAFDHSMRNLHTMPNTQIPNNQMEFAKFCYGNMPSCKDLREGEEGLC